MKKLLRVLYTLLMLIFSFNTSIAQNYYLNFDDLPLGGPLPDGYGELVFRSLGNDLISTEGPLYVATTANCGSSEYIVGAVGAISCPNIIRTKNGSTSGSRTTISRFDGASFNFKSAWACTGAR